MTDLTTLLDQQAAEIRALARTCEALADFISEVADELPTARQWDAVTLLRDSKARLQEAA